MASTLISNPVTNSERARESSKRRRKKKVLAARHEAQDANALRQVRVSSSPSAPRRFRAVREAADRVLAMEGGDGKVYDVTPSMDDHPRGDKVLLSATRKDAITDFEDVGHSESARKLMAKYYIGEIDAATIP
ncbi:hypothetical protein U1Q18_022977 [Sarracenia purpurea var. burkii]